jgi:hypothetical protein
LKAIDAEKPPRIKPPTEEDRWRAALKDIKRKKRP